MNILDLDRLVAYAAHCPAADVDDLATLPDWFLHPMGSSDPKDPAPQAVFAAYFLASRRDDPDLSPPAAFERLHDEPTERLCKIATAFALSCTLERLKRAGLLESYTVEDPYSLHGSDTCTFSEKDLRYYRSAPSRTHWQQYVRVRMDRQAMN
jgi:hypothetical protein